MIDMHDPSYKIEKAFYTKTMNDNLPMPYNFGPAPDTDKQVIIERLRQMGRFNRAYANLLGIDEITLSTTVHNLRKDGWLIDTVKFNNGKQYRLVYDAYLNRWWKK